METGQQLNHLATYAQYTPVDKSCLKANETRRFDRVENFEVEIGQVRPVAPDKHVIGKVKS
jgi:hypothetical protein